ncbi:DNA polymerase III subunit epsilon [Celerinatantimonas diazotrophica]|uniref:DNA polymerase III subunit epsilon n=1 Tax=Celerinatantimonas diazotrophica TaxID=412034 RepID=A0A4R1K3P8_9GAMM|nr:DNA polymerase III subunit epsilon [Celerinatantimonas diazotrophica]TCK58725.1 DNA polymerase-3 subunit epsilon [Celerinatantimonas diazotrophica]CAG9297356.1 DNA polymerase III subunit epsilon [Celerinatantimonas diazotrophica]
MSQIQQKRLIVFDTETTGMNNDGPVYLGHRVIEIGCVEVVDRKLTGRTYHVYIKPDRPVDPEAIEVHGITDEYLADKPEFKEIADEFIAFIRGAEIVAHNAGFDVSFLNHEFSMLQHLNETIEDICQVTDSLMVARRGEYLGREVQQVLGKPLPSRKNLDSLCDYYGVDSSSRTYHGALLDAELLAEVFLKMTGGQSRLNLTDDQGSGADSYIQRLTKNRPRLNVVQPDADELKAHQQRLELVKEKGGHCLWLENEQEASIRE